MFLEVLNKKRDKKVFAGRTEKRAVCQEKVRDNKLKSSMLCQNVQLRTTGRSKRNFPLPIFQNEPMGRINEYTYNSSTLMVSQD
jgi:hypothetical protein